MLIKIKNININYELYGNTKGEVLVYLHGWGQNIEMMKPIAEPFKTDNNILIIDLPGHGLSEEPLFPYELNDYVETLKELLDGLNIKNPILLGHSFGGKISLLYASKYDVKKLVLFGSPFKKNIKKMSLKTKILKGLKKVPLINKLEDFAKNHIGSTDYKNASKMMKQVLVNTVNLDITEDVKKIKCPTLLIWGSLDQEVLLSDAYELEKLIPDAGLVVYENMTHYAYLEDRIRTIKIIENFIK